MFHKETALLHGERNGRATGAVNELRIPLHSDAWIGCGYRTPAYNREVVWIDRLNFELTEVSIHD